MDHPHIAPLMFLLTTLATSPVVAKEVLDVATRGVFVRLLIEAPATPQAVAVLFAGGKGVLGILDDGQLSWGSGNFVVRSRGYFLNHGIATALIDGPSDRPRELWGFRETEQHATDIGAVISALRKRFGVPVWLVGTSRGTVSVAHAGVRLQQHGADGIALTASVLLANRRGAGILAMDLKRVSVPVFIAHHAQDGCHVTPPGLIKDLRQALSATAALEVKLYEGGGPARGDPCKARHFHGFPGLEKTVIDDISRWMLSHPP